tara:strand:+ start:58 stop:261 length:204 start_codon:yes stop_codon:yes gene_type:complete
MPARFRPATANDLGRGREQPSLPLDSRHPAAFQAVDADPNQLNQLLAVARPQRCASPHRSAVPLWRN